MIFQDNSFNETLVKSVCMHAARVDQHVYQFRNTLAAFTVRTHTHYTCIVTRHLKTHLPNNLNFQIIVVANYDPAGNYIGRYKENVLPSRA